MALVGMELPVKVLPNGDYEVLSRITGQPFENHRFVLPKKDCTLNKEKWLF
jgi:hypothetical protein